MITKICKMFYAKLYPCVQIVSKYWGNDNAITRDNPFYYMF